jgi:hypothetical protein
LATRKLYDISGIASRCTYTLVASDVRRLQHTSLSRPLHGLLSRSDPAFAKLLQTL